jgi:hypothetical protein
VILLAVYTLFLFLFIPETTYNRPSRFNTDIHESLAEYRENNQTHLKDSSYSGATEAREKSTISAVNADFEDKTTEIEKKKTYIQSLKVYNGRFSNENLLHSIISPFAAFMLPAVSWTAFAYGCSVAFSASFSVCLSQVFSGAPYHFTPNQVGLTAIGSFIGSLSGNLITGPFSDWLVRYLSKKNNGVYEPEFRNLLCIPAFVLGLIGFWGFGLSLAAKAHWIAPVFFFGLATFAGSILSLVSNAYLLDCHRAQSQDGYAAVTLGRGVFSFVMTFVINDWITKDGIANVYFVIGALHGLACVLGMVLYVYGKRVRIPVILCDSF